MKVDNLARMILLSEKLALLASHEFLSVATSLVDPRRPCRCHVLANHGRHVPRLGQIE
ncbi:MAG: hypothetical protein U0805_20950 [Pirellulales bacterium]